MRLIALSLLVIWTILNLVLALAARAKPLVAAAFAASGLFVAAGLALASPPLVDAGLAGSVGAPVLFGAIIVGRNHVTHHLMRALVVVGLAVFYSMT